MKFKNISASLALRVSIASALAIALAPVSVIAAVVGGGASLFLNPSGLSALNANVTTIGGSTKTNIQSQTTGATVDGDEVISVREIVKMAHQDNPFADNMVGGMGSSKPIQVNTDMSKVIGNTIVISTVERLGAPGVQGAGVRNGFEEQRRTGDFKVQCDLMWFGVGVDNKGKAQTILGANWDDITKEDLAIRLAKQQHDDTLMVLKHSAISDNLILPNNKTFDTLGTGDTYSYDLVTKSGGLLRDLGAKPIDARPLNDQSAERSIKIPRHLQVTTETNGRPIKKDSAYLQALQFGIERGQGNPLFGGQYQDIDNQIIYPMQTIQHGGFGSLGNPLQPEAKLGTAVADVTSLSGIKLYGGGSALGAAATPYVNYFENFSRFPWVPINGISVTNNGFRPAGGTSLTGLVTGAFCPRASYGYVAVVNADDGKVAIFRYTTNTAASGSTTPNTLDTLTLLTFSGSTPSIGNFSSTVWTAAADGLGYQGLQTTGSIPIGSKIYEVNAIGTPIGFGLGLGAMAAVCGYGRVPKPDGGFAEMARPTKWIEPHNRAFSEGLEVSWGVAPFQRPNGGLPNFVLNAFARNIAGFPVIA